MRAASYRRRFAMPVAVEGEAEKNQEEADGGAAGILEEDADCEGERAEDEDSGDKGIAGATIGARQLGLGSAETEERHNGEAVENPRREDEEVGELFKSSREGREAGENALKDESATGREKFGMDAVG